MDRWYPGRVGNRAPDKGNVKKCFQVPARYGEQGYGQHEYVYLGNDRRQEEYEEEEQQGFGQEGRYEQNGYGFGGNSQEVKTFGHTLENLIFEVGDPRNEGRGSAVVRGQGQGEEFVRRTEEEEPEEGACGPDCRFIFLSFISAEKSR